MEEIEESVAVGVQEEDRVREGGGVARRREPQVGRRCWRRTESLAARTPRILITGDDSLRFAKFDNRTECTVGSSWGMG